MLLFKILHRITILMYQTRICFDFTFKKDLILYQPVIIMSTINLIIYEIKSHNSYELLLTILMNLLKMVIYTHIVITLLFNSNRPKQYII